MLQCDIMINGLINSHADIWLAGVKSRMRSKK